MCFIIYDKNNSTYLTTIVIILSESTSCQPDLKGEKSHKNKRYDVIKKKPRSLEKKFPCNDLSLIRKYQKREKTIKKVKRDQRIYKKLRSTSRFEKKVVINDSSSSGKFIIYNITNST